MEIQKNILRKLQANLKWKNVRQFTHEQRAQLPQKVANQQKIVNDLRKSAATKQNNGILATITNKINKAVNVIKNNITNTTKAVNHTNQVLQQSFPASQDAVAVANQAAVVANVAVTKSKQLAALANRAHTLATNIRSMTGGKRNTRRK